MNARRGHPSRSSHSSGSSKWADARDMDVAAPATVASIDNGRLLAFHVLQQSQQTERFLQDLFSAADRTHRLSPRERGLAVDLANGVMRRRATLDVVLKSRISRPQESIEPDLWLLLQLGAYQLLFARTPRHAAVNETVELCRQLNRSRWTRFSNGVLRGIERLLCDDDSSAPAADSVPLSGGQFRRLQESIFPDPREQREAYLAAAFSLPAPLLTAWRQRFSDEQLLAVCFHSISPPATCLRVNPLKSNVERLSEQLRGCGCEVQIGQTDGSLWVSHSGRVDELPGFGDGAWSVQDESAMAAARLLQPIPGERILDLCAAPGGKTTHLAELSGDQASIVACDVTESRLARVTDNAARLGLNSISTFLLDKEDSNPPLHDFDAVLVDVPCSNTGVLNRRPEARWRFSTESVQELTEIQLKLLHRAAAAVNPDGRIVYSTCSMEPRENEDVVRQFLQTDTNFQLLSEQFHVSGCPADGGYQALISCTKPGTPAGK